MAHSINMHKYLKLISKLSGMLVAGCLTGITGAEAQPSIPLPAATPPAIDYSNYSFFQGLTFAPFPGTIPRPVVNGKVSALFPLVEVPTPGLIAAKKPDAPAVTRKKTVTPGAEPSARRRRRVIPKNKQ